MTVDRPLCACPHHARGWLRVARAHRAVVSLFPLVFVLVLALSVGSSFASAQSSSATLNGRVLDQSGAVVPGAQVTVVNTDSGFERKADTDRNGSFSMPFLPPGRYMVMAQKDGFAVNELRDVILNVNDQLAVSLTLSVRGAQETATVVAQATRASVAAGTGTVVDRQFIENIPLNGRSLHALMQLVPGVVLTANTGAATNGAQFSVSGQRSNANIYQVDGVSANTGLGTTSAGTADGAMGQAAGTNILGTTSSLASLDAVQEFRIETSNFAPEYGRSPGGHIALVTRSGTNALHGSISEYFRHESMNANDWLTNRRGLPKPKMRQHLFSATAGGPVRANRLFFFGSYETLRLQQPDSRSISVPNLAVRRAAPAALAQYLNAFPLPNGDALTPEMSQFIASYSNPATANSSAVRVDAMLENQLTGFVRISHAPSESKNRVGSLSSIQSSRMVNDFVTAGTTWVLGSNLSVDARANWTRNRSVLRSSFDEFGGAIRPNEATISAGGLDLATGNTIFRVEQSSLTLGSFGVDTQRQLNFTGTLAWIVGSHQVKMGADYLRLNPELAAVRSETLSFSTLQSFLQSRATLYLNSNVAPVPREPVVTSFSLYAQDAWQLARRLTVTYGARFERVPPPRDVNGQAPPTIVGLDREPLANPHLAPAGTPMWRNRAGEVALRLGAAYQLRSRAGWETTLRGGGGSFYDLGLATAAGSFRDFFPFSASRFAVDVALPIPADLRTPVLGVDAPSVLNVFDPNYRMPYTRQWHLTLEQALGASQTLTIGYVAAQGRRLTTLQAYRQPFLEWPTTTVRANVQRNAGRSRYDALQVQYQRRLHRGLQALASYTLSDSRDNASADTAVLPPNSMLSLQGLELTPSDFDARHVLSLGVTFDVPSVGSSRLARAVTSDWAVDAMFRVQSGFPRTPTTTRDLNGVLSFRQRADRVSGEPVIISDPTVPGGKRVNPAAFVQPSDPARQGTASRNSVRMRGVSQLDFAIRRDVGAWRGVRGQFKVEVFNILNEPSYGPYEMGLGSQFGRVTAPLNTALGGLSALYQMGGPRSVQLSMRALF